MITLDFAYIPNPPPTATNRFVVHCEPVLRMSIPETTLGILRIDFEAIVPNAFLEGLADIQHGRLVDIDTAHEFPPPD